MNFLSMKTRVAEETGLDLTNDLTKLGTWINEAYKFVSSLRNWPWLLKDGVIQTVEDISTTASVSAGDDDVIVAAIGTDESIQANYMVQFTDESDDWYLITSHTAGQSAFTITPNFLGTSDYSSGTCLIRKISYSLASDVDKLIDFRDTVNKKPLEIWDVRNYDRVVPDPDVTGNPRNVVIAGLDTSSDLTGTYQYWRAILDPIPDQVLNIHYRYYKIVEELNGDTDLPLLPEPWHQVIPLVALATFGHPYIDDSRMSFAQTRARQILKEMIDSSDITPSKITRIQAWDQRSSKLLGLTLPNYYPLI